MTPDQAIVYVQSQVACALIEMEGMRALNTERESHGYSIAYDEEAFLELPKKYGINHAAVIKTLSVGKTDD